MRLSRTIRCSMLMALICTMANHCYVNLDAEDEKKTRGLFSSLGIYLLFLTGSTAPQSCNISEPQLEHVVDPADYPEQMLLDGGDLLVAEGIYGLSVISSGTSPLYADYLYFGASYAWDIAKHKDRYYLIDEGMVHVLQYGPGRKISPVYVAEENWMWNLLRGIAFSGNYGYGFTTDGLEVLDLENELNRINTLFPGTEIYGAIVDDAVAYVSAADALYLMSLDNPAAPVTLSTLSSAGSNLVVAGSTLYLTESQSIAVFDVQDKKNPRLVNRISQNATVRRLSHRNGCLFAAGGTAGVQIYDLHQPSNPVLKYSVDSVTDIFQAIANDTHLYVSSHTYDGFNRYRIGPGNPPAPVLESCHANLRFANGSGAVQNYRLHQVGCTSSKFVMSANPVSNGTTTAYQSVPCGHYAFNTGSGCQSNLKGTFAENDANYTCNTAPGNVSCAQD